MSMKTVLAPTKGRVVFYQHSASGLVWPSFVVEIDADDPHYVRLAVLDGKSVSISGIIPVMTEGFVLYGEDKPGCWWWPPHSETTMEVED